MSDNSSRSDRFLWQQQRLREESDRKHAAQIQSERQSFYSHRDAAAPRRPRKSNEQISADVDYALSLMPVLWIVFKWFLAYMLWHMLMSVAGGLFSAPGIFVTVVFIGLTIWKQVRRRRKRRG
ncbi:hypothetical protein IV500_06125 [Paeniglutamicibacter antarcticus]|uniref:Uncharacterized protein n=1 Tax=Arthrobacter terrae TaxID=2935737 RepID=A0A931G503_9MICC|nr:hypothetical protein [Arthrobacter terrae]MBG0739000.1 hypothetical protein [Arthrobacter terrae]